MRRAWLVLLAGCGFQSPAATPGVPMVDASNMGGEADTSICLTITDTAYNVQWSACTKPAKLVPNIDIMGSVSIDTDEGSSVPSGFNCAPVVVVGGGGGNKNTEVCALVASSIKVESGAILSAHGRRPLALFGHSIDIEGTVDVASHIGGQRGAGAVDSCPPSMMLATGGGGGAGGTYSGAGGRGGDQGGANNTGGLAGATTPDRVLQSGCDGRRSGDGTPSEGPNGVGGAGGGAVWIASDMGMLKLGVKAVINASGAGGKGATMDMHGGDGGGSGGMIVLQSSTIQRDSSAQIFANGGGGGGGCAGSSCADGSAGIDGGDSIRPSTGGAAGAGGDQASPHGDGGLGFPELPEMKRDGHDGEGSKKGGGGGGGGGQGYIRVVSTTAIDGPNVSPVAVIWGL